MKRTHLIAVLVGVVAVGIFATDAHAMYHPRMSCFLQRDPGAGGAAPQGEFIPRDQYREGMNLYQYVRSKPVNDVDPAGNLSLNYNQAWFEYRANALIDISYVSHYMFIGQDSMPIPIVKTYQAGTWDWVAHANMQAIKASDGTLVGYDMAAFWLEDDRGHSQADWNAFVKAHNANQACGAESTAALEDVLKRISDFYKDPTRTAGHRKCLCSKVFDLNKDSGVAWDINQLFELSKKGFREPSRSVRVSGKCYDAGAVNYAMYGLMGKLCGKSIDDIWGNVYRWKQLFHGHPPDKETAAWMKAGYDGWKPTTDVYSLSPYSLKGKPAKTFGKTDFSFTWLPYMYQGKEGDTKR